MIQISNMRLLPVCSPVVLRCKALLSCTDLEDSVFAATTLLLLTRLVFTTSTFVSFLRYSSLLLFFVFTAMWMGNSSSRVDRGAGAAGQCSYTLRFDERLWRRGEDEAVGDEEVKVKEMEAGAAGGSGEVSEKEKRVGAMDGGDVMGKVMGVVGPQTPGVELEEVNSADWCVSSHRRMLPVLPVSGSITGSWGELVPESHGLLLSDSSSVFSRSRRLDFLIFRPLRLFSSTGALLLITVAEVKDAFFTISLSSEATASSTTTLLLTKKVSLGSFDSATSGLSGNALRRFLSGPRPSLPLLDSSESDRTQLELLPWGLVIV